MGYPYPNFCLCAFVGPYKRSRSGAPSAHCSGLGRPPAASSADAVGAPAGEGDCVI